MVNFNGQLLEGNQHFLSGKNRGFLYGDGLFETIRVIDRRVVFWEDHYLRLMASMRILRMQIPMTFTMEFLQEELLKTLENSEFKNGASVRITVFRNEGGSLLPKSNEVSYLIEPSPLENPFYIFPESNCEVELFKDFTLSKGLLSNLRTINRLINVLGSIYAKENHLDDCILLNENKMVTEVLNGNIFLVKDNIIQTPPLEDGCLKGIIRKKLIEIINKWDDFELLEQSISPFSLQQADELFYTNSIQGIVPITKYRKKMFDKKVSQGLLGKLNAAARFS
jgi:branched-chain amino acid aminotransferase